MNNTIAVILTLLYIVIVATLVIKKYNSVFVFLVSGMAILLISAIIGGMVGLIPWICTLIGGGQ